MTYREQIEKALATFEQWPKDQQDVYLRMLDDLKAQLKAIQKAQARG